MGAMIAPATAEAVSLLSINWRIQMRQNDVDFQNRELPNNSLALLLVTTRTPDDTQRHQEQTAMAQLNQSNVLARLLVTTRHVTSDDTRVLRHCDFPDSSARRELPRRQEQTAIAPLNQYDRLAAMPEMAA
jgi:hypothetical protein